MNVFSANFRYGHMTKFSNIHMFQFIPKEIKVVLLQARNAYFSVISTFIFSRLINKIKNFMVMKNGDNLVSYEQTYNLAREINKRHDLYFLYSLKLNHDDIIFLYWLDKLHAIESLVDKKSNKSFNIQNIEIISTVRKAMHLIDSKISNTQAQYVIEIKEIYQYTESISYSQSIEIMVQNLQIYIEKLDHIVKGSKSCEEKDDLSKLKHYLRFILDLSLKDKQLNDEIRSKVASVV